VGSFLSPCLLGLGPRAARILLYSQSASASMENLIFTPETAPPLAAPAVLTSQPCGLLRETLQEKPGTAGSAADRD
jgi:hypothetical protein